MQIRREEIGGSEEEKRGEEGRETRGESLKRRERRR